MLKVDFDAVEREFCNRTLTSGANLAGRVLGPRTPLTGGWALDTVCLPLEAVTDGRITRLLMNVPPGTMKSLLTGVIWPAWEWGPRGMPWKRYVGTAHEETLAIRDSRKCRDLIKSEWYQRLWPMPLDRALDGKREFGNIHKGVRQARAFTSMTGVRGDCLLAGAMVETEDGIKDIKDIVMGAYSGNVLSYDHDSKQLVYRPVQAVARRSSLNFYRIHFADGCVVECTGDHRIYTARGYVEARLLSEGDACLRMLREDGYQNSSRHEKTHQERLQEVSVSMVERVCKESDVYDIQVDGTHCFFANGVLVHNCVIIDDPLSADGANSDAKLEAVKTTFLETVPTRINSDASAIVVIMQRLHEKDTSGIILGDGLPYVHLCIPMRFEPDRRCTTSIGWTDPRTATGELMFPERFGEVQVSELERTLGTYGAAGQLQQRPVPRGGGMFKDSWWRLYTVAPEMLHRCMFADTAQKTAEANDWSVFQVWGMSVTNQIYLIDQIRGKWEAPELLTQARAFWRKHQHSDRAPLRGMWVEDKSSGTGLIQTLAREGVPVIPIQRNKDKISRANDVLPIVESGQVYLPQNAEFLSAYMAEFGTFPMGAHDDQIDPTIDAISNMMQQSTAIYAVGAGSQWAARR